MRVERVVEPIPEKVTSLLPVGFRDKLHVWHGLRRLLKPAMYSALLTVTATSLILGCSTTPESRIVTQVKAITTPISDSTPEPSATTVPPATATKEPTTPTLPPTLTPEPSATTAPATPTRTPTAEATPTPKPPEKSPLPVYSVYAGDTFNEQGVKEGKIVVASIPETGQLAVYYIKNLDKKGFSSPNVSLLNLQKVEGSNLVAANPAIEPNVAAAGRYTIQASLEGNILSGKFTEKKRSGSLIQEFSFRLIAAGAGKEDLLKAARIMKSIQTQGGYDPNKVNVTEFINGLREDYNFELPPS